MDERKEELRKRLREELSKEYIEDFNEELEEKDSKTVDRTPGQPVEMDNYAVLVQVMQAIQEELAEHTRILKEIEGKLN